MTRQILGRLGGPYVVSFRVRETRRNPGQLSPLDMAPAQRKLEVPAPTDLQETTESLARTFRVVIAAGIARVDFRQFIGFNLVYAALWFVLGVLCFTFLPA